MASFTSRLAGWAAGRLKGEKARKKTMEFVDKTGVGKALGFLGDAALLGGAGKLAGMGAAKLGLTSGVRGVPALPKNAPMIDTPLPKSIIDMGANVPITPRMAPSLTQRLGTAAGGAMDYLKKRPEVLGQALTGVAASRQAAANRQVQREQLAQREKEFEQTFGQSEQERQREIDRQRRIAEMLAPLFQRIAGGQG